MRKAAAVVLLVVATIPALVAVARADSLGGTSGATASQEKWQHEFASADVIVLARVLKVRTGIVDSARTARADISLRHSPLRNVPGMQDPLLETVALLEPIRYIKGGADGDVLQARYSYGRLRPEPDLAPLRAALGQDSVGVFAFLKREGSELMFDDDRAFFAGGCVAAPERAWAEQTAAAKEWIAALAADAPAPHADHVDPPAGIRDAVPARALTDDERIEDAIVGADIVCLARVLRVNAHPSEPPAPRNDTEWTIEPIEFMKGGLDFDDSLSVAVGAEARPTTDAMRKMRTQSADAYVLFFYDAGGYWKLTGMHALPARPGEPHGTLRVPSGKWTETVSRVRRLANLLALDKLIGGAEFVVLATPHPAAAGVRGTGDRSFTRFDVEEVLKGTLSRASIDVRNFGMQFRGRQLLVLVGEPDRFEGPNYHELPYGAATYRARFAESDTIPAVTDAEIAEIRSATGPPKEHITRIRP